jgi:hypothetical protein
MEQMLSRTVTRVSKASPLRVYSWAEDTRGSLGVVFNIPLLMVRAGLHWSRRMSRQMLPFELIFGW